MGEGLGTRQPGPTVQVDREGKTKTVKCCQRRPTMQPCVICYMNWTLTLFNSYQIISYQSLTNVMVTCKISKYVAYLHDIRISF